MEILFLLFIGWTITSGIVNGSILDKPRRWTLVKFPILGNLLSCIRCLGFWAGFLIFGYLTHEDILGSILPWVTSDPFINYLIFPFLQSSVGVIIESVIIFLRK